MKSVVIILAVCTSLAALPPNAGAQAITIEGSANYVSREIPVRGTVDALIVESNINIEYRQSTDGTTKVELYGSDNVMEYMDVRVSGSTLTATMKGNNIHIKGDKAVKKVIVTSPCLRSAKTKSSGNIYLIGDIKGANLTVRTLSSGSISGGKLDYDKCVLTVSSSGNINIENLLSRKVEAATGSSGSIRIGSGTVVTARYDAGSSGSIRAEKVRAEKVIATTKSSGNIDCYASVSINGKSKSSGSVIYDGDPRIRTVTGNSRNIRKK